MNAQRIASRLLEDGPAPGTSTPGNTWPNVAEILALTFGGYSSVEKAVSDEGKKNADQYVKIFANVAGMVDKLSAMDAALAPVVGKIKKWGGLPIPGEGRGGKEWAAMIKASPALKAFDRMIALND